MLSSSSASSSFSSVTLGRTTKTIFDQEHIFLRLEENC